MKLNPGVISMQPSERFSANLRMYVSRPDYPRSSPQLRRRARNLEIYDENMSSR